MEHNYLLAAFVNDDIKKDKSNYTKDVRLLKYEFKRKKKLVYFTIDILEGVGKSLLISILDLVDKNPQSRIISSPFNNLKVNFPTEMLLKYQSLEIKIAHSLLYNKATSI